MLNALILLPIADVALDTGFDIVDKLKFAVPAVKFTDGIVLDIDRLPVNPPADVFIASVSPPVAPEIAPPTAPVAPEIESCIPLS